MKPGTKLILWTKMNIFLRVILGDIKHFENRKTTMKYNGKNKHAK